MSPRWGLLPLLVPIAVLSAEWAMREPPSTEERCAGTRPPGDREAWMAGLAPEAFVAGAFCAAVALWASARRNGGSPATPTSVAAAVGLACGAAWWAYDAVFPLAHWGLAGMLGLAPSVLVVPGLVVAVIVTNGWRALTILAWWCGLVVVPGFVTVISLWGEGFCGFD